MYIEIYPDSENGWTANIIVNEKDAAVHNGPAATISHPELTGIIPALIENTKDTHTLLTGVLEFLYKTSGD